MSAREIVVRTVALAGGSVIGRVRLQKILYLLGRKGLSGPFSFSYHYYGPYSRDVDEAISRAKAFFGLQERIRHRVSDGVAYSVFEVDDRNSADANLSLGGIPASEAESLVRAMVAVPATVIEIAGTIVWLRDEERVADWRSELIQRKGAKASPERIEKALTLLEKLSLSTQS